MNNRNMMLNIVLLCYNVGVGHKNQDLLCYLHVQGGPKVLSYLPNIIFYFRCLTRAPSGREVRGDKTSGPPCRLEIEPSL